MPDELHFANERRIIPTLKKAGQKRQSLWSQHIIIKRLNLKTYTVGQDR